MNPDQNALLFEPVQVFVSQTALDTVAWKVMLPSALNDTHPPALVVPLSVRDCDVNWTVRAGRIDAGSPPAATPNEVALLVQAPVAACGISVTVEPVTT